jgi:hypothetical protein
VFDARGHSQSATAVESSFARRVDVGMLIKFRAAESKRAGRCRHRLRSIIVGWVE